MHISKPVLALAVGLGAGAVQADTVAIASRPDLTLSLANQLADATLAACHARQRTAVVPWSTGPANWSACSVTTT